MERIPVEIIHPSEFIQDELDERGWTLEDIVKYMDGDYSVNLLTLELLMAIHDDNIFLDQETAEGIGRAFGTSPQFWINLWDNYRLSRKQPAEDRG